MKTDNNHIKRWILPKPIKDDNLVNINLSSILQKVLIRRGIDLNNDIDKYITPSALPNPEDHFSGLSKAT